MRRYATYISLLICGILLSACGGGGGGGGSGSGGTPIYGDGNYQQAAGLAARVLDITFPNFNEGYPVARPAAPLTNGTPAPANCPGGGTVTRTVNGDGNNNNGTTAETGESLTLQYNGCVVNIAQEASNCIVPSTGNLTLTGPVRINVIQFDNSALPKLTAISTITYGDQGSNTQFSIRDVNNNETRFVGSIELNQSTTDGKTFDVIITSGGQSGLRSQGAVRDDIQSLTLKYTDVQDGCSSTDPNNNKYVIAATNTKGTVVSTSGALSGLPVNFTVTTALTGSGELKGHPTAGVIQLIGEGSTSVTVTARPPVAGDDPTDSAANIVLNGGAAAVTNSWDGLLGTN